MSLLTDTAHTPERIFALLKLLNELGGEVARDTVQAMMDPDTSEQTAFTQTVGAAASLDLVATDRNLLRSLILETPASQTAFSDVCYDRLLNAANGDTRGSEAAVDNALLWSAYAIVALKSDQNRCLSWFCDDLDVDAFSNDVRNAVSVADPTAALFNRYKFPPWRRWMLQLGLMEQFDRSAVIPDVSRRLKAEILRSGLPERGSQAALQFLVWARTRMPFLPGGRIFVSVAGQAPRPAECGVLLSAALRNLRDEGILRLTTVGDAAGQVSLSPDDADFATRSFSEISFKDRTIQ
jgi:hypothetical protein